MDKKEGKNKFLHGAIYPNANFEISIVNCSASGKKGGGDDHVVKA